MKHLFSCLKKYRLEAVLSPLFKLLEACMELLVPLVVAAILNTGVENGDRAYILHACLLLVAFGVLGLGFALTAQYFAAKAAVGTSAELRSRLFSKLQSFSFTQIDDMGAASMLTRMTSDTQQVQTGVNMTLRLLLRSPIVVFGAAVMAFVVDPLAALVFVGVIPLLALAVFAVMRLCIPKYRAVQERLDGVYLSARENLTGARVLRAFRMEAGEERLFEEKTAALRTSQIRVGRIAALSGPVTYLLVNLAVIALIWAGAVRVELGALKQGDVVALYNYLALILVELVKFANLIVTVTKSVSCMKRIGAVLDEEGEPDVLSDRDEGSNTDAFSDAPAVSFSHVGFTYEGGSGPALTDIHFTAARGETVGILGGTGSGKSTLVRLIPRFYAASEGEVRLFGKRVDGIPLKELRGRIGYVPQHVALFSGTIASNLRWGKEDATEEELNEAVRVAQAEDVVAAKGGLDGVVEQEGRNLSGGQRQRLTIARALVKRPEVLILDDASSALDFATDARLRAALKSLDCTVFLVSQRVSSVMHADKILVLDEGSIADMGTHDELMARCPLYGEIYRSQTEGV